MSLGLKSLQHSCWYRELSRTSKFHKNEYLLQLNPYTKLWVHLNRCFLNEHLNNKHKTTVT